MKHNKLVASIAVASGVFAMSSAHAFAPAVIAGLAALGGAAVGAAAANPPAVAVVPSESTVVMGAPPATVVESAPVVQEVIPAARDGYHWMRGHYEVRDGLSTWVAGHWVANDVVIYEH
jgi:hypothetical protein